MSKGLPPSTHALGFLRLFYGSSTEDHQVNFWVNDDLSPSAALARATAICAAMLPMLSTTYAIRGFAYGHFGDAAPVPTSLPDTFVGTREPNDGAKYYESASWTITMSGIGTNPLAGEAKGKARIEIVPGVTIGYAHRGRYVPRGVNTFLDAFNDVLNDPTIGITNIYGQSAAFYPRYTVQFNAQLQQKRGT